jgi:hypothetical protein
MLYIPTTTFSIVDCGDEATAVLLKQLSFDPDVERARAEFDRAQKVEERFHTEFDGLDFTKNALSWASNSLFFTGSFC